MDFRAGGAQDGKLRWGMGVVGVGAAGAASRVTHTANSAAAGHGAADHSHKNNK